MDTGFIQNCVYDEKGGFAKTYRNAAPFVSSGGLWDYCMSVVTDERHMTCIAFANEMGIPPVKSLLYFYEKEKRPADDFKFRIAAHHHQQRMTARRDQRQKRRL